MISLPYLVITLIYITGVSLLVTSVGRECIVYTCYYDNNQLFKNISLVWCCNNSNTLPPVYSFDCRLLTKRLCAALCLCPELGAYWAVSPPGDWCSVECGHTGLLPPPELSLLSSYFFPLPSTDLTERSSPLHPYTLYECTVSPLSSDTIPISSFVLREINFATQFWVELCSFGYVLTVCSRAILLTDLWLLNINVRNDKYHRIWGIFVIT